MSRPDLKCRWKPGSQVWEIVLVANADCDLKTVELNGEKLNSSENEWLIPTLDGRLKVIYDNGEKCEVPLVSDKPLIFKLKKDWSGDGRRIKNITNGYFIVFAPVEWKRKCHPRIETAACDDVNFLVHYFHSVDLDHNMESGFDKFDMCPFPGISLEGTHVFDDADEGVLFVGNPPSLKETDAISWVRIGEEAKNGWGCNFSQDKTISQVLKGREGHFFLRVYDSDVNMLDSMEFRYLRRLKQILVNDTPYTHDLVIKPKLTGHIETTVCFDGISRGSVQQVNLDESSRAEAQTGVMKVTPIPGKDGCQRYCVKSKKNKVNIVLQLPHIWWGMSNRDRSPDEWLDKQFDMTREDFLERIHANKAIHLRSTRNKSVSASIGESDSLIYKRKQDDDVIVIPLIDFAGFPQIRKKSYEDNYLSLILGDVSLPLIRVLADPLPKIESFKSEPETVFAGSEVVLSWTTRNTDSADIRIDPAVGSVEANGSCIVRPRQTTTYNLTFSDLNLRDSQNTLVTVLLQDHDSGLAALISARGAWRVGKGFSFLELMEAGLTFREAKKRSMPIDQRRKSVHTKNIQTIRRNINA